MSDYEKTETLVLLTCHAEYF